MTKKKGAWKSKSKLTKVEHAPQPIAVTVRELHYLCVSIMADLLHHRYHKDMDGEKVLSKLYEKCFQSMRDWLDYHEKWSTQAISMTWKMVSEDEPGAKSPAPESEPTDSATACISEGKSK